MAPLTPAEQYVQAVPRLDEGVASLLEREHAVGTDIERDVDTFRESLEAVAAAYIERLRALQSERDSAIRAAEAMSVLAGTLGRRAEHTVPPSRVATTGGAGALNRAASRGTAAVVFELASLVASQAAREM